ncbi:MAG: rod shape-determining protein MreD [Acidimicrobiia bacterium]
MTPLVLARWSLVVVVALVLQTTVFAELRLWGGGVVLGLVLTTAVAFSLGSNAGAVFGFIAGLLFDLFLTGTPLGLSALSYTVAGYALGSFERSMLRQGPLVAPVIAGAGSLIALTVFVGVGALLGDAAVLSLRTLGVIVVTVLANGAVAPFVFPIAQWAMGERERSRDRVPSGWNAG